MDNREIAERLHELADLYELDGAISYRVIAYREAARAIEQSPTSAAEASHAGSLTDLAGVGKTIAEKVAALLADGEIPAAAKLKQRFPATLVEVTRLPGLGAKTARLIHEELGIDDLDGLKQAAEQGRLRDVKGLGPKTETNVLEAIAARGEGLQDTERRVLLSVALPLARELADSLAALPECEAVEIAGSARRWAETCKDVDLIATATDPAPLIEALAQHPRCAHIKGRGEAGIGIVTHDGVPVDLRVVDPALFGNLLQHFTGSKQHNVRLREDAVRRGLKVSEYGVTDIETGETTRCATEREVYERLGLAYVEPELREGRGELEAAREDSLPELVGLQELRGDLHCHTTLSDGRNTVAEMAAAARELGHEYLALTDHSASHGFGNDVSADQLRRRIEEIREFDPGDEGFALLAGSEVNIGTDGTLDYDDDLLAALDWVVASVHTAFQMGASELTERIATAMRHPQVDCIGHLTGRLIGRRPPYAIGVEHLVEVAAETGTMFEINGNPNRRDLSEHHARLAADAGVPIVCTTDAHGTDTLTNTRYAVATARRAWLRAGQVANTRSWKQLAAMRKPTRG